MKIKRIVSFVLAVIFICAVFAVPASAQGGEIVVEERGVTFVFDESTPEEQIKKAIDFYFSDGEIAEPRNVTCDLFGHKYVTALTYSRITHKVYASAPRCRRDYYRQDECSRCGHVQVVHTRTEKINCC